MSLDGAAKKPSGVLHNLPPSIGKSKVDNEFRRDSCCNFGKNPLFYGVGYSRIVEGGRILASLLVFLSALFLCASAVQADERGSLDSLRRELSEIERQLLQGTFRETDLLTEIDARERQIALQTMRRGWSEDGLGTRCGSLRNLWNKVRISYRACP
jgi:hypothetical protein